MKLLKKPKPRIKLVRAAPLKQPVPKTLLGHGKVTLSKKELTRKRQSELDSRAAARAKYAEDRALPDHDARRNLAQLETYAKVYVVTLPNGKTKELPVVIPTAMGEPLDTTGVTITRWLSKGMLPAPVIVTSRGGKAYHLEEVRSFMRILGEHQQHYRQYRQDHTDVTDKLFRENALLRKSLFNV